MSYVKNEWKRGDIVTAEKLNHMEDGIGGGWPSDLPKPSVGGYGYTEGDGTTITWDGDTSGKTIVENECGEFYVKIADNTPNVEDLIGGRYLLYTSNGVVEYTIGEGQITTLYNIESEEDVGGHSIRGEVFLITNPVVQESGATFTQPGMYFYSYQEDGEPVEYISSLSYGNETVHKIDEKYLPASGGGALVVHMTGEGVFNEETLVIEVENGTLDHTVKEIYDAGNAVIVYDYVNEAMAPNITTRFVVPVCYFQTGKIEAEEGGLVDVAALQAFTTIPTNNTFVDIRGVANIWAMDVGGNLSVQANFSYIFR